MSIFDFVPVRPQKWIPGMIWKSLGGKELVVDFYDPLSGRLVFREKNDKQSEGSGQGVRGVAGISDDVEGD